MANRAARMRNAFDSLPAVTRAVFIAHCHEELAYDAIAARLAIPVGDVVQELAHALAVLDRAADDNGT
jgi:DNA-directed RNA polymerase specialized sigma24 family protein